LKKKRNKSWRKNKNNLRYVDDTTISAEDKQDLKKLLKIGKGRQCESRTDAEPKKNQDNDNRNLK
jgi:hypothetical protein